MIAHPVVRFPFAVDTEDDEVQLAKDAPGRLRPQEHATRRNGIEISQRMGGGD